MDRDTTLEYVKDNLVVSGISNIIREVMEDGEELNQDFTAFPLIIIDAGDSSDELFTSSQSREELNIKVHIYTQGETSAVISNYVKEVKNFFRTDYKLGNTAVLVSNVDIEETISGEGEVQETIVTATALLNTVHT